MKFRVIFYLGLALAVLIACCVMAVRPHDNLLSTYDRFTIMVIGGAGFFLLRWPFRAAEFAVFRRIISGIAGRVTKNSK